MHSIYIKRLAVLTVVFAGMTGAGPALADVAVFDTTVNDSVQEVKTEVTAAVDRVRDEIINQIETADGGGTGPDSVRKNQKKQIDISINTDSRKRRGCWAGGGTAGGSPACDPGDAEEDTSSDNMKARNYLNTKDSYKVETLPADYAEDYAASCVTIGTDAAGNPTYEYSDSGDCAGFKHTIAAGRASGTIRKEWAVVPAEIENIKTAIQQNEEQYAGDMAVYQAMAEESYTQSSKRFQKIQALLDQIDEADEPKDIADLQARIQGEQMMLQNEQVKLTALSQMQQGRRDGYEQRKKDLARYPTHGHKSYSPAITAARAAVVAGTAAAYAVFSAAIGAE